MPIGLALIAGGLSTLNPCGFSLLPAMLSLYIGSDAGEGASSASRMRASLRAGARVTAGFLSVFIVVGLPVVYGLGSIVRAVPWAGAITGIAITLAGLLILSGRHIGLNFRVGALDRSGQGNPSMYLFGVAYAVASLGCTLPVFLSVVGASLAVRGAGAATVVLAAYGVGMGAVMMTLALVAGGVRDRLVGFLRRALPRMQRISGALLLVAGVYLSYYWLRILFGPIATLADDPVVGTVQRFTSYVERLATANGRAILIGSLIVLAGSGGYIAWRWGRSRPATGDTGGGFKDVSHRA
ncbi:MAG: cytochrome c biogenesis CcdA family protein [Actinobacteria bacterium]|nr:cytochrome c biogenesis CcdA family protein [Actinomycetota bacterium]